MTRERIYLDAMATTPVDERVLESMLPCFTEHFGNPSSRSHPYGWEADSAVSRARADVVSLLGARSPREIVFTSGATESNNLALQGVLRAGDHVVVSAIEHPCILETVRRLEERGVAVTVIGVSADGLVAPADVEAAMRPETKLVSVMSVNNEVGTVQPIRAIAEVAKRHGALTHTDAAQGVGRIDLDVRRDGIDLLSLSAHKLYGPKGIGALYVRRGVEVRAQTHGGGQERGVRAGTLNVPGIVGLGAAARLARELRAEESARLGRLRDAMLGELRRTITDLRVHGSLEHRVAANLHVSVPGLDGEVVLAKLPEVAMSAGSACSSGKFETSHVLAAMGVPADVARGAIRIGLGRHTTEGEVRAATARFLEVVTQLRAPRNRHARPTR